MDEQVFWRTIRDAADAALMKKRLHPTNCFFLGDRIYLETDRPHSSIELLEDEILKNGPPIGPRCYRGV